ncbi:hypothetical protein SAMN05216251_11735 [Actinacidiphila alni]|uniref:Uncharacterized protein n=2 Tax=Actinacidiphila alni TaxID=380248 RepID=A0A1I2JB96_9ACTN|nr:hypothetical protein SAMN05216251_11735 [Actinacidiphila alni]
MGNHMGKKIGFVALGVLMAVMAVMSFVGSVRSLHTLVLIPPGVATAVASWYAFRAAFARPVPATEQAPRQTWYR